jgi:hypothetical protein
MKSEPTQTRKELRRALALNTAEGLSDALKNRVTGLAGAFLKAFGEGIRVVM